ncbi:FAD/NAD(P)-binding domain-containing protein [Penicillium lividum]|nr:FAD/NAD(P)-binding domain-containing protein [Penicillium lividum]
MHGTMKKCDKLYSDVIIIGAGLSGIDMACQLQRQLKFRDYVIYDRATELGGAWAANKYPGCGVDIPGVLYSLSWFPNPNFTSLFPTQKEILAYIQQVALANDIPRNMRFRTEWQGARWIESSSTWQVYLYDLNTRQEFLHETKVLISAVGGYTNPKCPILPGLESFEGPVVHTAKWDKEYDLRGQKVAVIGNGCSGSQVVPAVIDDIDSLTQFIRSPQHYVPMTMGNYKFGNKLRSVLSKLPFVLMILRWLTFWLLDTALGQFYNDPQGKRMRKRRHSYSRKYITKNAPERYWPLLTPDYNLGCRRRILDNQYIRSLHSPKMNLVKDTIRLVRPKSLVTSSGEEHNIDFIILATGFEFTQWQAEAVIGRHGRSLQQHWDNLGGITAYKSVAVNEFPNMFYLLGPNSGSGHTSVLFSIEW